MSQRTEYESFVARNDYHLSLGKIMGTKFACEYRRIHSELRADGWTVEVDRDHKHPSKNMYWFSWRKRFGGCRTKKK